MSKHFTTNQAARERREQDRLKSARLRRQRQEREAMRRSLTELQRKFDVRAGRVI